MGRFVGPPWGKKGGSDRGVRGVGCMRAVCGAEGGGRTDPTRTGSCPRASLCVSTASGSTPSSAEPESARREGAGALRARSRLALRKATIVTRRAPSPAIEQASGTPHRSSEPGRRQIDNHDRRVHRSSIIEFL